MGSGDNKMIYFQNGIKTNDKTAKSVVNLIGTIINNTHDVGLIHNDTESMVADIDEYDRKGFKLQDTLTAHTYEKIAKSGEKSLIILHSAGNQDYYKAATYAAFEGKDLSGLEVMSVGSPRSLADLQAASDKVNVNFLGQYNDWKDPVTHSMSWGVGASASLSGGVIAGGIYGVKAGAIAGSAAGPLGVVFGAGVGVALAGVGAIPSVVGYHNVNKYHGIESYLNRNQNGVRTDIQDWAKRNRRVN
jgi:hypothetical protein